MDLHDDLAALARRCPPAIRNAIIRATLDAESAAWALGHVGEAAQWSALYRRLEADQRADCRVPPDPDPIV